MQQRQVGGSEGRLVCRAGTQLFAIPRECVIEVMRALPVNPVAEAPPYVQGLSVIRGEPVVVVDLGRLVGDRTTPCGRLVAVRCGGRRLALAVGDVLGIWPVAADKLNELPPLLGQVAGGAVASIAARDAELMFLLRTASIVPEQLFDRLLAAGGRA